MCIQIQCNKILIKNLNKNLSLSLRNNKSNQEYGINMRFMCLARRQTYTVKTMWSMAHHKTMKSVEWKALFPFFYSFIFLSWKNATKTIFVEIFFFVSFLTLPCYTLLFACTSLARGMAVFKFLFFFLVFLYQLVGLNSFIYGHDIYDIKNCKKK